MTRIGALVIVLMAISTLSDSCPGSSDMSYLDNGVIRVGIDLKKGGTITFLADAHNLDVNLINAADLGREVQQSYYSGPQPYGNPSSDWENWGWNPIGAGDCYGNPSEVIEVSNDGITLYVKSIPKQWALNNVPCECTFEKWIQLDGTGVRVHFRLNNNRSDTTVYSARDQELPAVYTPDRFYRMFAYTGSAPFSGGAVSQVATTGPPWVYFNATEKWAALVDDNNWGMGVYNPRAEQFAGGFSGSPGSGNPTGSSCGYIAPLRTETIYYNTVYDYEIYLILGYVDDIRAYVYQHR